MNLSDLLSPLLPALLNLPAIDLILSGLATTALLGWLLGVLVGLYFTLTRRCRMNGSPPWWAILAFGLATATLLVRQYLNGTMATTGTGGKWAGYAVVGMLCMWYALRCGRSVQFRLFGEYGCGGYGSYPYAVVSATSRIPVTRLVLHVLFWGIVLWTMSRMIPHAPGRNVLLLTLLLGAGTFPFAKRTSLLDWALKSEEERDRSRGLRFMFCGGGLILVSLVQDHVISPNRWVYFLAGLICLLIGLDYRGSGLNRLLGADTPAPGPDGFPVFQPVSAPMRHEVAKVKVEPLVEVMAEIRSRAAAMKAAADAEPTLPPDDAGEAEYRHAQVQPEVVSEATPAAAGSRFRLLFLWLGLGVLLYAAYLWRDYLAHDGYGGIVALIMGVFNSVLTLIGLGIFGRAFRRPGEQDAGE